MKKVNVGIDLGTTYSAVATFSKELGRVQVYKNSMGAECTPSVLCIENGKVLIGEEAKSEQKMGNTNTISCYKSMMGNANYTAYLDGEEYTSEDLSGLFLKELVQDIEKTNDIKIESAVITVPAYFIDAQREATLRAGKKAGLNVLKIINEPTSAIIAYGLTGGKEKNVLVYDLGGGTFDVTIAHVKGTTVSVLATNGNHQLGGQDWDAVIAEEVIERFDSEYNVDINGYGEERNELKVKCEEAKKRLSAVPSTTVSIQCEGFLGKYEITREWFDERTDSLLKQTLALIRECFGDVKEVTGRPFGWQDIDEVVLVGGSTKMPQVRQMILNEYKKPPITRDINVDTIVATGAAIQAELCTSEKITMTVINRDKTPGGAPTMTLTIHNSDIQDVTAHSLGMLAFDANNKGYINSIIIRKNSKVNEVFSRDYTFAGEKLLVYVMQGESRNPYDTDIVGAYSITGMPNKECKIRVDFLYNSNGVVEVGAKLQDGTRLSAVKEPVNETLDEIIARLEREKAEAEERARRNSRIEVMLFIDTSYSMQGSMDKAHDAAKKFIAEFDLSHTYIAPYGFGDYTTPTIGWSNDRRKLENAISSIKIASAGGCNAETPIKNNYQNFSSSDHPRVIVVLTDGMWNDQETEEAYADIAKRDGILIYGIGIGGADEKFLERISSGKGRKVDLSQLSTAFKEVASSIATEVGGNSLR